jgi:hypothetical protein
MITYTTNITAMYTVPNPQGYVTDVWFTISGTDGTYTAQTSANLKFTPEQSETEFIPFNELTQDEVIGWINSATNNQANYYANIDTQINAMITPPVSPSSQPLPWGA